eukprot:6399369-Pyramimonas_sp.AAC.1
MTGARITSTNAGVGPPGVNESMFPRSTLTKVRPLDCGATDTANARFIHVGSEEDRYQHPERAISVAAIVKKTSKLGMCIPSDVREFRKMLCLLFPEPSAGAADANFALSPKVFSSTSTVDLHMQLVSIVS